MPEEVNRDFLSEIPQADNRFLTLLRNQVPLTQYQQKSDSVSIILDLGSGSSEIAKASRSFFGGLNKTEYVGVDPDPNRVEEARETFFC